MGTQDFSMLKDSTLIVVTTFRHPELIQLSLDNLTAIISDRPNTYLVIIDNKSKPDVTDYLKRLESDRVFVFCLPFNFGKALASNFFLKEHVTKHNIPKTIVSMDPDVVFSKEDFNYLIEASENLPQCGMIGMRFTNNACNPERNLFFKPKKVIGLNKKEYQLKVPFMCTVAGPILAMSGRLIFERCNNELFPKKYIKVYGGDDSALYDKVRWSHVNGYLEGTEITHMSSGATICLPEKN